MLDSFFAQPLSKSCLVYLLVWNPLLHTPYISSPNRCLLFTTHTHTISTHFAVVPRLCHLILISLSFSLNTTSNSVFYLKVTHPYGHSHHPYGHSHLCLLKFHLIFFSDWPGLTSIQHISLQTTSVQSPSHYQW